MTDVFEVAKPKSGTNALGAPVEPKPKPAPKPRQPPKQDVVAAADVVPTKRTRKKRAARVDTADEHMLFMRLYNELKELPKGARSRLLVALARQLT
jgi:hypothetical protein